MAGKLRWQWKMGAPDWFADEFPTEHGDVIPASYQRVHSRYNFGSCPSTLFIQMFVKGTLLTLTISISFPVLNGRKPMSHISFIPKQRNINDVLSLEHLFIHLDVFFEKTHKKSQLVAGHFIWWIFDPKFFKLIGFPKKPGSKMTNLKACFFWGGHIEVSFR